MLHLSPALLLVELSELMLSSFDVPSHTHILLFHLQKKHTAIILYQDISTSTVESSADTIL